MRSSAVTRAWLVLALSVLAPGLVAQTTQAPADGRAIDWKKVIPAVASDQKRIWTFPLQAARGKHWAPVLGIAGVTVAMIAADPHEMPYFRRTGTYQDFNHVFSGKATDLGTLIAPVSLYAAGLIRKDSYMQKTALLAGVAVADTAILTVVMKGATGRLRPRDVPAGGDFGDTWFQSKGSNWLSGRGSFPLGTHDRGVFGGHRHLAPLSEAALAALRGLRTGWRGGILEGHVVLALPVRGVCGRRAGLLDQPLRGSAVKAVALLLAGASLCWGQLTTSQEPATVANPLDFSGLSDFRLPLISERAFSWTAMRYTLQGANVTDAYQPGRMAVFPNSEVVRGAGSGSHGHAGELMGLRSPCPPAHRARRGTHESRAVVQARRSLPGICRRRPHGASFNNPSTSAG